jgi:elongator complex protein 1
LSNGSEFLNQVEEVEYLNLFLTQLNSQDVTKTLYSSFYKNEKETLPGDKIQLICSSLMKEMKKNEKKYISSILTTYKKMNQLEEALFYLKEMKDRELSEEVGLKYLIFLSNVDELYDIALGMYDVELVLLIAKKSQKDPKEYLRFFEEISKFKNVDYQHYKIDLHLKKYGKALKQLSKCQQEIESKEILSFIDKYALYVEAIPLFPSLYEWIHDQYGDYLKKEKKFKQSAHVYLKGNQWEKAQFSFIQCGDVVHTFSLSKKLLQTKEKVIQVSKDLISILTLQLEFKKISFILVEYLNNVEDSILLLCKHSYWNDAIQYSLQYNRLDLLETNIKPSLLSSFKEMLDFIFMEFDKMKKHLERLIQVRQELSMKSNVIYYIGGEFHEKEEFNDAFSDTSSVASGYSGVSIMSTTSNSSGKQSIARSKSKRNKLKKGSPFEEDLLVKRLYSLIPTELKQCKKC